MNNANIATVGAGVSYCIGSDSYPYTVRRVSPSGKTLWATSERFVAGPGNTYERAHKVGVFVPPAEAEEAFTLRADGTYRPVGSKAGYLSEGRTFRQDPCF